MDQRLHTLIEEVCAEWRDPSIKDKIKDLPTHESWYGEIPKAALALEHLLKAQVDASGLPTVHQLEESLRDNELSTLGNLILLEVHKRL